MSGPTGGLGLLDVAAFAAELAVYAAAGWWGWVRPGRRAWRLFAAVAAVLGLALPWGWFAAPTADHPLHGAARTVFELCWFGAGALAAVRARSARRRSRGRGAAEVEANPPQCLGRASAKRQLP